MSTAKLGDKVKVHYTGVLDDGTQFDTSLEREPLEFVIGEGMLIKSFEDAVIGLKTGENKNVHILARDAYGLRREDLIAEIPKSNIPDDIKLEIGLRLQMQTKDDQTMVLKVVEISEDKVTLDANHELAGENLNFDIELVEITEAA